MSKLTASGLNYNCRLLRGGWQGSQKYTCCRPRLTAGGGGGLICLPSISPPPQHLSLLQTTDLQGSASQGHQCVCACVRKMERSTSGRWGAWANAHRPPGHLRLCLDVQIPAAHRGHGFTSFLSCGPVAPEVRALRTLLSWAGLILSSLPFLTVKMRLQRTKASKRESWLLEAVSWGEGLRRVGVAGLCFRDFTINTFLSKRNSSSLAVC